MNCETCQTELEDLLYGELNVARTAALTEHLSGCNDCHARQVALEHEQSLFAQYYQQNALEPSDEMWQAIHVRIKDDAAPAGLQTDWKAKLQGFFLPLLTPALLRQAGLAILLVLVSVGLTTLYFSRGNEKQPVAEVNSSPLPSSIPSAPAATPVPTVPAQAATPRPPESGKLLALQAPKAERKPAASQPLDENEALTQQIAKATREYQGAIRLLERTIAKRKTELDEGTIKQFEGSLAMIDASIAASREAMQAHPNDPTAARYLLTAYSKKVELMQEIAMR